MRKRCLAQMIACLLLLTACAPGGKGNTQPKIREFYAGMQTAQMDVRVRADFGDRMAEYLLRYSYAPDGETVTVLEPGELRDVSVTITPNGSQLQFDGLVLETGALPGTGLSPLEAVPFAVKCWREGYVTSQARGPAYGYQCVKVVYASTHGGRPLQLLVWFDAATLLPVRSETYAGNTCVLTCEYLLVDLA